MKVLHKDAPQSSVEDMYSVIREDFGKNVSDIFQEFDEEPIGTASLAQVHRAKLKDGTEVAVKIQHPMVKKHSFVDMNTMELLVRLVAKIFPEFQFLWLAEETKKNLPLELDFIHEGHNCDRVARMFQHFKYLIVPKVRDIKLLYKLALSKFKILYKFKQWFKIQSKELFHEGSKVWWKITYFISIAGIP